MPSISPGFNYRSIFQPTPRGAEAERPPTIPKRLPTCLNSLRAWRQMMNDTLEEKSGAMARLNRAILAFELSGIVALQFLLIAMIFASTVVLFVLS